MGRLRGLSRRFALAAFTTSVATTACDRGPADLTPTDAELRPSAGLATGEVDLFIRPGGEYRIGVEDSSFNEGELASRLDAAYSGAPASGRVLNVFAYPGVVGYDVVVAVNAARENGVETVEAIADYGDTAPSRLKWKRWKLDSNQLRTHSASPDTLGPAKE